MKRKIASLFLLAILTIGSVSLVAAAIGDEKRWARCHDENGKFIEGKDCDPNSCGCLFHEIAEFLKDAFDF